jgi:hypothetical protein
MRFKVLYLFLLALLWQGTAFANTVVTATSIVDSSNTPISSAQLCFQPTNIVAQPTGFKVGTTSVVATPVCRLVTNGVLATGTSVVPSASGILYHIFLTPVNNTTTILKDYGYTPITGTTWSLDTFNPNNSVVAPVSTVSYGTLTPLSPGAGGWCNLTGSSPSYKLNCGIPVGTAGATGPQGPQGPPPVFRGAYSSGTTYAVGDLVSYSDGSSYISLLGTNTGHSPDTSSTYWHVLAQGGSQGPPGVGTVSGLTPAFLPLATGPATIGKSSPLSVDDVTTPTKVTSTVPINATALNGVYDLKTAFGATGSIQTMNCTATASSANLTCTGGDFKVGDSVFIPGAGTTATATTPATPTATCTTGNGGSCTGSNVYCYIVVGIQGEPNGPLTAPSAAGCVTQAAQSFKYSSSTVAWVNTTVSWTTETNVSIWAVYKSVNGGPYNYYTMPYSVTSFTDNGTYSSTQFGCAEDGVPCVAPSAATPNDVYAKITAINSGTYTIAANTHQPNFRAGFGLSGAYPSIPSTSGTFVVQHDDTPALTEAYIFLLNNPSNLSRTLKAAAGNYNFHVECNLSQTWCNGGNGEVLSTVGLHDLTFTGDGKFNTHFFVYMDRSGRLGGFLSGICSPSNTAGCTHYYAAENVAPGTNVKALNEPIPTGATQVTLSTPSDISLFPKGQWIMVFPNNQTFPCGRALDLNQVVTADATTGTLGLKYPIARYYATTLPAPWSDSLCSWPPVIAPVEGGLTAYNLTFKDFHLRGDVEVVNYTVSDNFLFQNLWIEDNNVENSGLNRHVTYLNNTIHDDGNQILTNLPGILTSAYGDSDKSAIGNTYIATHQAGQGQNCVESSANVTYQNNNILYSGLGSGTFAGGGAIGAIDRCFNFRFLNNDMSISNADVQSIIRMDGKPVDLTVKGNKFSIDAVGTNIAASATTIFSGNVGGPRSIADNTIVIGTQGSSGLGITAAPTCCVSLVLLLTRGVT